MRKSILILLSTCLTACSDSVCITVTDSAILKVMLFIGLIASLGALVLGVKRPYLLVPAIILCIIFALGLYLIFSVKCNLGIN